MAEFDRRKYTDEDYVSKLLLCEKQTIIKALKRTKGVAKSAHFLLCPNDSPYRYNHLLRVIKKHSINLVDFK